MLNFITIPSKKEVEAMHNSPMSKWTKYAYKR